MDNPTQADGGYIQYQADPHGFCVEYFKETYTDDVKSVMESVRDNVITIAKSANATGKSHCSARIAAWFYKCFPGAKVFTTAAPPEKNLKTVIWGEMYGLTAKHPEVFADDLISADMNIGRNKEEFITGVTIPVAGTAAVQEAKFSGKHAPYLLFIVDEGDAVPEAVYKGIESCMSGGHARLLIMFNPRSERGPVARMEKQKQGHICQLSALVHPNVVTGTDVIPGAVTRETTIRRINQWTRPLLVPEEKPDIECFEVPEYLVGETCQGTDGVMYEPLPAGYRKVTVPSFFYMVLGRYPPQAETQLISHVWVDAAVSRWLTYVAKHGEIPPVRDGVAGLDVAEFGGDWNILCPRYGGWVPRFTEMWKGIDTDATAIKAAQKIKDLQNRMKVFVDGTGLGAGVAPRMKRKGVDAVSIKVASSPTYKTEMGEFLQLRDQLWWSVMEWLRTDPGAMLPPDEELAEELCTPLYWTDLKGKVRVTDKDVMRDMLGRSPDKADALNLTFAPTPTVKLNVNAQIGNYAR